MNFARISLRPAKKSSQTPSSTPKGGQGGSGAGTGGSYRYVAVSPTSAVVDGIIKAADEASAEATLTRAGYRPLVIHPVAHTLSLKKLLLSSRVKPQELLTLTEQLAVLLRAGVPLVTTLESLRSQFRNPAFNEALVNITEDVRGGLPLSAAMGRYPNFFSALYVQMITLGERSGDMESILEQIRVYFSRELALRKKIKRALSYPTLVIVLAIAVAIFMVTVVLPKIVIMFEALEVPLPLLTRIVLGASKVITQHELPLAAVLLLSGLAGFLLLRQPRTKLYLHRAILRLPLLKTIVIYRELGRFSRLCSLMLRNGLPLPAILSMVANIAANLRVKEALQLAQADVTAGDTLSASLRHASFIPPMFMQMVRTGEMSGNLGDNLSSMADFYDRELDALIESALGMLEPALTIAIGAVIGGVALSVIGPIYTLIGSQGG